jgi:ABC-type sugar transport system substrate-binding protein
MESLMHRFARALSISAAMLFIAASSSAAAPLGTMDEVGAAILACWNPPAGTKGSFVTLSFSFKRDGTLIGPPRPTEINVAGDEEAQKQFVDTAIAALENCLPLEFSPALAAGIGGQVFTLPFASPKVQVISPAN